MKVAGGPARTGPQPPPNSHPRTRTHLEEARNLDARSDASLHLLLLLQLVLKGGGEHVGEEFERNLGRGQGGTWAFVCEGGAPHPLSPPRTFPLRTHRQQHLHEWHQHKHQEGHQAGGGASRGVQGRGGGRAACATPHPPSRALPLTGTCRPSCASAAGAHACKVEGASVCVWGGAECRQLRARGCPPPPPLPLDARSRLVRVRPCSTRSPRREAIFTSAASSLVPTWWRIAKGEGGVSLPMPACGVPPTPTPTHPPSNAWPPS